MSRAWHPGQLLFVGFEGETPPPEVVAWIRDGRVGGVILFTRNLEHEGVQDPHRVRALVRGLRELAPAGAPLTVAIDQEGGRVQRLGAPWTSWPAMRRVGELGEATLTAAVARGLATELRELGIGLDFAPVVDVDTNAANPVIGDRSFAATPQAVEVHATAFITAMQTANVAACAKHFPGHGDTTSDSHLELPRIVHDLDRLRGVELVPFAAAAGAGVASIMTAHVVFEALDKHRPATLSPAVMDLLRGELGYDGLVFSDDLEMKAVLDHFTPQQMVSGALEAGVDAVLASRDVTLAREVLRCLEKVPDALLERGLTRMVEFKRRFALTALAGDETATGPPYAAHRALADRIARGDP